MNQTKRIIILFIMLLPGGAAPLPSLNKTSRFTVTSKAPKKQPTIAIFDTSRREPYVYQPVIDMLKAQQTDVFYHPLTSLLDEKQNEEGSAIPTASYDIAFFVLCGEFLKTLRSSLASKKIISIIDAFSRLPNKTTVFLFPSIRINHPSPLSILKPLFRHFSIDPQGQNYMNRLLQTPHEQRHITYHTTLKSPSDLPFSMQTKQDSHVSKKQIATSAILPMKQIVGTEKIQSLLPLAAYGFNKTYNNHLIVSRSSLFCTSISENFQICPFKHEVREELHRVINQLMHEIAQLARQKKTIKGIHLKKLLQSNAKKPAHISHPQERNTQKKNFKVAWMDLTIFQPTYKHKNKKKQQKTLVEYIGTSKLDYLWITSSPNMYYSPFAKKKHDQEDFVKTLSQFTKALSHHFRTKQNKSPRILVGFEIANNLYKPNLPVEIASDLYGNSYHDVPRPLNEGFWRNEVTAPLEAFMNAWKKKHVSNNIKIGGIVIDLEMYCRQTTSTLLPTMGFESETIFSYIFPPINPNIALQSFTKLLMVNNLTNNYFSFLEDKAQKLGRDIHQKCKRLIPNGIMGCYAPNISTDWFYKGLYAGMSNKERPLFLFTFNADFKTHKAWLLNNNIQAYHLCPLMLSKIRTEQDLKWANYIINHHDGIWINRYSRLIQAPRNDWSYSEQTPMPMEKRGKIAQYLGAL